MDREKVYQMYRELAARETAYREEQSENDRRLGIKDLYREEAARGTRMLYELGFSPSGDNGDISVRDPETGLVYISASPIEIGYKNLGEYHACDMAVVDMEGNRMTTWSRPTIEVPMHLAILRAVRRQRGGAYPRRLVLRLRHLRQKHPLRACRAIRAPRRRRGRLRRIRQSGFRRAGGGNRQRARPKTTPSSCATTAR